MLITPEEKRQLDICEDNIKIDLIISYKIVG
jgi:hypothetical protein